MLFKKYIMPVFSTVALFGSAAAHAEQPANMQGKVEVVGLRELAEICHNHRNNSQIEPGEMLFKCVYGREFWKPIGSKDICLANEGGLCMRANIKDDRYGSNWLSSSFGVQDQKGKCHEYEQWRTSTSLSQRGSCDLIDAIIAANSEVEYCEKLLRESGRIHQQDHVIQMAQEEKYYNRTAFVQQAKHMDPHSVFEPTGKYIKCESNCQEEAATETSSSSSSSSDSSSSSSSSVSSSDQQPVQPAANSSTSSSSQNQAVYGLNHYVRVIRVPMRGKFFGILGHQSKILSVVKAPAAGSPLARLGLKQGDRISHIGFKSQHSNIYSRKRMKDLKDLQGVLRSVDNVRQYHKGQPVDVKIELVGEKVENGKKKFTLQQRTTKFV